MDSITSDIPISLRSWPSNAPDPSALPTLIQRINFERGGFLNITEESLRQEIAEQETNGQDEEEASSSDREDEEEPDRMKELMEAREELLKNIGQGLQTALLTNDLLSLVLTKVSAPHMVNNLSPALAELVPPKTLGTDKLAAPRITEQQKTDNKQIAKGMKAESVGDAVDFILKAATRLEKEIEHETKYWEQVLAVSDSGWAVCRLPDEKHILGVRYGFSEASPAFKNRSLAVLRRNPDGSISLDSGVAEATPKSLRIRIQVDGEDTGASTVAAAAPEDAPIESLILQARNTTFAEELWQELNREARGLAPVEAKDDSLIWQLSTKKTVIIDLVSLDEPSVPITKTDFAIAESIYLALNLLLSYSHRQTYRRRTQPRNPISPQKESTPPVNLLRVILTRLTHQESIIALHSLLGPLCSVLKSASITPPPTCTSTPNIRTPPNIYSNAEKTIMALHQQLEQNITLHLTKETTITITLNTHLYPPCSLFYLTLSNQDDPLHVTCLPSTPLMSFEALKEYLFQATACALTSTLTPSLTIPSLPLSPQANGNATKRAEKDKWTQTAQANLLTNLATRKQLLISLSSMEPASSSIHAGKVGVQLNVTWGISAGPELRVLPPALDARVKKEDSGSDEDKERSGDRGEGGYCWVAWEGDNKGGSWGEGEGEVVKGFEDVVKGAEG